MIQTLLALGVINVLKVYLINFPIKRNLEASNRKNQHENIFCFPIQYSYETLSVLSNPAIVVNNAVDFCTNSLMLSCSE